MDYATFLQELHATAEARNFTRQRILVNEFIKTAPVDSVSQFFEANRHTHLHCSHHNTESPRVAKGFAKRCLTCAWITALATAKKILDQINPQKEPHLWKPFQNLAVKLSGSTEILTLDS